MHKMFFVHTTLEKFEKVTITDFGFVFDENSGRIVSRWKDTYISIGHFRVPLCLCFKASLSAKHSCEYDFDFYENETACRTHFHMNGFALRPVLKQRHKRTWQWPIIKRFQKPSFSKCFSSTKSQSSCGLKRVFEKLGFRNGLIVWTEGLTGEIKLFLRLTFAGVLQGKIRTRAVLNETPTTYISVESL